MFSGVPEYFQIFGHFGPCLTLSLTLCEKCKTLVSVHKIFKSKILSKTKEQIKANLLFNV